MSESISNAQAFEKLLEVIKEASGGIQRDAGTRFETLTKVWFTQDQAYKDLFSKVETYKEWALSHPELSPNAKDIGIDLVGTLANDPSKFAAIQCKFYDKDAVVPKTGIASFASSSNRSCFVQRFVVATNERWSDNAEVEMSQLVPPITLITRSTMADSSIDWNTYATKGEVKQVAKREPRPYQEEAIDKVIKGFADHDRGKLIMACGTGKTFTSMKIAEQIEGKRGFVMFLVPSLALLSQTLTDWKRQCCVPIHAFAVCSDSTTGKADLNNIDEITSVSDLCYPATTRADALAKEVKAARQRDGMTVIFSTYQSIEVVSEAQKQYGMDEIGLVICDEAHRTAGGHYQDEADAPFHRIHDNAFIKARKRLYMTATPRIYGNVVKEQQAQGEVVLYSMDDEGVFGPTFHTITFSQAVALGSLVDYKVIVLSIEEDILKSRATNDFEVVQAGGLPVKHAAKVVGCWRALSKLDINKNTSISDDLQPMRRAVGFAQIINPNMKFLDRTSSKLFAKNFEETVEEFKTQNYETLAEENESLSREAYDKMYPLKCETKHIDGSMNSTEKTALLNWLRESPEDDVCKILFNVRCLSEGVDVPSLDAVLFLSPRKSQVEVVQTVGRVMRVSPETGKKRGYVIIPIVTPAGIPAEMALDHNKDFDIVWQVLNALKSIDTEFGAIVDGQRQIIDSSKIEVVCLTNKKITKKSKKKPNSGQKLAGRVGKTNEDSGQGQLDFNHDEILENEIRARIVKRVGNRREWGDWAEDVGEICRVQIKHIQDVLAEPKNESSRKAFSSFQKELKATLNGDLEEKDVIEMLGQHVVTQPILDALFTIKDDEGNVVYQFTKHNPIAKAMTTMMEALDKEGMMVATESLKEFYRSVSMRTRMIKNSADRQMLIKELFEKFFKKAFPNVQEKLGIVYTPVEIVDFINNSVKDLLKEEFEIDISQDGVHVLDPFAGTGTFIVRLMQNEFIPKQKLPYKFQHDLHATEIVPLAYYVASMNLEGVFHELCPNESYKPNKVMIWADTFVQNKNSEVFDTSFGENNSRLQDLNSQDVKVIIGNPPYSVGQSSANDNNENTAYPELDNRIRETYFKYSKAKKNKLDSYKRAFRFMSDRLGNKGVIGVVCNNSWIMANTDDGLRKCLCEEFDSIKIFDLRGNQNLPTWKEEGDKIFEDLAKVGVAIVFFIKNALAKKAECKIDYYAVPDCLSRGEKISLLKTYKTIKSVPLTRLKADEHNDWLSHRQLDFAKFLPMISSGNVSGDSIFKDKFIGISTNRDLWVYSSSRKQLQSNVQRSVASFAETLSKYKEAKQQIQLSIDDRKNLKKNLLATIKSLTTIRDKEVQDISWTRGLRDKLKADRSLQDFSESKIKISLYRPFFKQFLYYDASGLVEMPGRWRYVYKEHAPKNYTICTSGPGAKEFSCLMVDTLPCLDLLEKTQGYSRFVFSLPTESEMGSLDFMSSDEISCVTQKAVDAFKVAYDHPVDSTSIFYYIYGLFHSPDYRERYANNLMREFPRIPRVATYEQFMSFVEAGQTLADLHVNFENVKPYAGVNLEFTKVGTPSYRVSKMKWGTIKNKKGNAAKDKTTLIYNDWITVKNIPLEAQEYVVNKKSALDWIVKFACVSIDESSGIVNDFNEFAATQGNERYPLDLFLRVITVSLETMKIVKSLPKLEIHPLDS